MGVLSHAHWVKTIIGEWQATLHKRVNKDGTLAAQTSEYSSVPKSHRSSFVSPHTHPHLIRGCYINQQEQLQYQTSTISTD